jgi:hypothetical protein
MAFAMNPSRKQSSAAVWATVVVVVALVGYAAGFGPAIWFGGQSYSPWVSAIYWPMGRLSVHDPRFIRKPLVRYASAFAFRNTIALYLDYDIDGEDPGGTFVPTEYGIWELAE